MDYMSRNYTKKITINEIRSLGYYRRLRIRRALESSRKAGVYIVAFQDGLKVGKAANLKRRLAFYKKPWCKPVVAIKCYATVNPHILERMVLEHFQHRRLTRVSEFLRGVTIEQVCAFIENLKPFKEV